MEEGVWDVKSNINFTFELLLKYKMKSQINFENDFKAQWLKCLKLINKEITIEEFKIWFIPIEPLKFEDNILTVRLPSVAFYEVLE